MPKPQSIKHEKDRIRTYLDKAICSRIILPNFQRTFVWDKNAQEKLLASILAGIPMGSILLLEGQGSDYSSRILGYKYKSQASGDCEFLLDGQQRLSVLRAIFSDLYSESIWQQLDKENSYNWSELHKNVVSGALNMRWFLKMDVSNDNDPFGYKYLDFPNESSFEPSDYEEFIHHEDVHRTKTDQWFSPAWEKVKDGKKLVDRYQLRLEQKREAARLNLIPLWEVFHDEDSGLHVDVIDELAYNREEELFAKFRSKGTFDEVFVEKLKKNFNPNIEDDIDYNREKEIKSTLSRLSKRWVSHMMQFLKECINQDLPYIFLPKNELHRGIAIFETINRGGTPLSVYDLLVAKYARLNNDRSLTDILRDGFEQNLSVEVDPTPKVTNLPSAWSPICMKVLKDGQPTPRTQKQFINVLGVLSFLKNDDVNNLKTIQIKRDYVLKLNEQAIDNVLPKVVIALSRSLQFLQFRLGIVDIDDLQYQLMLLPIAACLADDEIWESKNAHDMIEYWYWASLFSGVYRERQNENCINDIKFLYNWVHNKVCQPFKKREENIFNIANYSDKLTFLRQNDENSISSNVEVGVKQYILSKQPKDILDSSIQLCSWSIANGNAKVHDHHIIPLATSTTVGQSSKELRGDPGNILNSVCNRTFILDKSNQNIGNKDVNSYWKALDQGSLYDHIVPKPVDSEFKKKADEDDEDYYKRVLSKRFSLISDEVKQELRTLVMTAEN